IALQRIEAEKKRHDERRGYHRTADSRSSFKPLNESPSYSRRDANRAGNGRYLAQKEYRNREQSILSRTARSNSGQYRSNTPSLQYRVVERIRPNSGSSDPQQNSTCQPDGPVTRAPLIRSTYDPQNLEGSEITPTRTLKERLGPSSDHAEANSNSRERKSALERISEPSSSREQTARRSPSFESGRLQLNDTVMGDATTDQGRRQESPSADRVPATLRLGSSRTTLSTRRGTIPLAPQSKVASNRKVTRTPRKRVARSPLLIPSLKKTTETRSSTSTRRRLVVDKDPKLPCDKADNWNVKTSPKLKDFLWRVIRKAIPVSSNLERRGVPSFNCKKCGAHEEDLHVFLTCPLAEEVWNLSPIARRPVSSTPSMAELLKQGNTYTPLPPTGLSAPLWPWIIWNLWKSRNKLVFENKTYTAQEIVLKSITDAKEWSEAQASQKDTSQHTSTHTGSLSRSSYPPPTNLTGMLVCNVDAAWNSVSGNCGIGGVFSGYNASNLPTLSEAHSHESSALIAEALAIHRAVALAVYSNVRSLAVLSDSLSLWLSS
ncbi:hypothetical protein IGI04_031086, partial [Brassica rapa subsp. trilocularis]